MTITKTHALTRFNQVVHAGMSPAANHAVNYYGNIFESPGPEIDTHEDLGPRLEAPVDTAQTINVAQRGALAANSIFNILHNFAMKYTRVRQAKWIYMLHPASSDYNQDVDFRLTALKPELTVYFELPSSQPVPGTVVTDAELTTFLNDLLSRLNFIRNDTADYAHIYGHIVCHGNCHSACHGSRGRR